VVEARTGGAKRAKPVPARRMRAGAKINAPEHRAGWQDVNLGCDRAQHIGRRRRRQPIGHELADARSKPRRQLGHDVGIVPRLKPLERSQRRCLPFPLFEVRVRRVEPAMDRHGVQALRQSR